jgi:hypothetical protein
MRADTFRIEGKRRPDGTIYFTSRELPGFRLLLEYHKDLGDYVAEITEALKVFYPLYKAAEAQHTSVTILPSGQRTAREPEPREEVELTASFALA